MDPDSKSIVCKRELEGGARDCVKLPLPALVTVQSGINQPRYASLSNVLRVKKLDIPVDHASELGTVKSSEKVVRGYLPERISACLHIEGSPEEVAARLLREIRTRAAGVV